LIALRERFLVDSVKRGNQPSKLVSHRHAPYSQKIFGLSRAYATQLAASGLADGRDRPGPFAIFRDSAALCRRRMWSLLSSTLVARLIEPAAQHYQRFIDSSDDAQHLEYEPQVKTEQS